MLVLVCYDVNTETKAGRRRLRRVAASVREASTRIWKASRDCSSMSWGRENFSMDGKRLRLKVLREIVENGAARFRFHLGAPACHFSDFAVPLGRGEALLAHHMVVMAGEAGSVVAWR